MTRLQLLEQYLQDDPNDPFNLYALALECQKTDAARALQLYETLVQQHTAYVPTYYHYGKLLQALRRRDDALAAFQAGMVQARNQQEAKALRELQNAAQELEFDDDY